jgi:hypothetical protein
VREDGATETPVTAGGAIHEIVTDGVPKPVTMETLEVAVGEAKLDPPPPPPASKPVAPPPPPP